MQFTRHTKGLTIIELLVGMLITGLVLSAVATFAFALSTASLVSGDTAVKQRNCGRRRASTICRVVPAPLCGARQRSGGVACG
jgi:Tfp pilus assembly protein PilW